MYRISLENQLKRGEFEKVRAILTDREARAGLSVRADGDVFVGFQYFFVHKFSFQLRSSNSSTRARSGWLRLLKSLKRP